MTPLIVASISDSDVEPSRVSQMAYADVIELRVDLFENNDLQHIKDTFQKARSLFGKPLLGTVRDPSEGGNRSFPDRPVVYELILDYCSYIDIELAFEELIKTFKDRAHQKGARLIGSYHNFIKTPDEATLNTVFNKGVSLSVDIIKIAVMAKDREDLIRLLFFTHRKKGQDLITISMGNVGFPSRVIGGLFGSIMTYGYIGEKAAPGQIDLKELRELIVSIYKAER